MISVEGVTKSYGPIVAVDHVSFEVDRGEVLGFLGPNGAGKTTTMRMLTGTLQPDQGAISFDGVPIAADLTAAKSRVGYLPEANPLYDDMLVCEFLEYVARLRGLDADQSPRAIGRVVEGDRPGRCLLPTDRRDLEGLPAAHRIGGRDPARARDSGPGRADRGAGPQPARRDSQAGQLAGGRAHGHSEHSRDAGGRSHVRPASRYLEGSHRRRRHRDRADGSAPGSRPLHRRGGGRGVGGRTGGASRGHRTRKPSRSTGGFVCMSRRPRDRS